MDYRDQSLTPAIAAHGYWESWITAYITEHVKDKHFLDLGANCGYYSLLAASFGAKSVRAYEPNPKYVRLLRKSAWENGFNIEVVEKAISDKKGSVDLSLFGDLDGGASIMRPSDRHIRALSTTLDSLGTPTPEAPVLMKVDVEGAEEKVFDGGQKFLNENQVTMVLEYTPGAYSDEFFDKLSDYGSVNMLNHQGHPEAVTKNIVQSKPDWITLVVKNY